MIDLGDALPDFAVEIRDAAGQLANATTVTATLTLPDLTVLSPSVSNPSTGRYTCSYITTMPGRHVGRFVATGTNASSHTLTWDVEPADPGGFLSISDAKQHLNISATTNDDELRLYTAAVSRAIESYIGPVGRRSVTEVVYPISGVLRLKTKPALSLTSITPYAGVALSLTGMTVSEDGVVYPGTPYASFSAVQYTVVYVAGRVTVPPDVTLAARLLLSRLWETQRGGSGGMRAGGFVDEAGVAGGAFAYLKSYGVRELLDPYRIEPVGVA